MKNEQLPLAMAESFWANSHLSIARYTGRIHLGKYDYVICNKDGKDIFECSMEAQRADAKRRLNPGNRPIWSVPTCYRFTGNWAGMDSCISVKPTRIVGR